MILLVPIVVIHSLFFYLPTLFLPYLVCLQGLPLLVPCLI